MEIYKGGIIMTKTKDGGWILDDSETKIPKEYYEKPKPETKKKV